MIGGLYNMRSCVKGWQYQGDLDSLFQSAQDSHLRSPVPSASAMNSGVPNVALQGLPLTHPGQLGTNSYSCGELSWGCGDRTQTLSLSKPCDRKCVFTGSYGQRESDSG